MNDADYMRRALALGMRNLGQVWPNPAVGALVVKDGRIIGEGWTGRGGRPHAETIALGAAGDSAKGATLYVTLEPCAHHGKTPPCADAIITSGIARCVIACRDPNPAVNGKGIAQLKNAGIEVVENVCEQEARASHEGFFSVIEKKRPFVALKIATSADEKIAWPCGEKKWITSEKAREHGQLLRSQYDAILTGIGTVLADDPLLTVRIPGLENKSPVRVVLDRNGRLPEDSQLAKTAGDVPVWVIAKESDTIEHILQFLTAKGITRLLVEAGQAVNTSFLASGLVDRVYWFKAPAVIGEGGLAAVKGNLTSFLRSFSLSDQISLSPDTLRVLDGIERPS